MKIKNNTMMALGLAALQAILCPVVVADESADVGGSDVITANEKPGASLPVHTQKESIMLAPVTVQASRLNTDRTNSATKTDTPLLETPQAISVISEELLRDRGTQSLQDALRYSAGVMSDAYGLDNRTDSAIIRGTEFQQWLDGMRETFNYYNIARPDPYALERVEIVRGPASVLYGEGPVSGVVALVSKRPQATAEREIAVQYGSFDRRQAAVDFTGPLMSDGRLLYRLVGLYRDSDSQVDYAIDDRRLLSPSFTWNPSDSLQWTVLATYQHDKTKNAISFLPHSGTALPNPNGRIPISRFTSEPDFDRFDAQKRAVTSLLEWRVSEMWTLRQNARLSYNHNPYYTLYPDVYSNPDDPFLDASQRTVARYLYAEERRERDFTADTQAQARFATGGLSHTLLTGVDLARSRFDSRAAFDYIAEPFDLYDPNYGAPLPAVQLSDEAVTNIRFTGVYAQDQLRLGHWIGVLGLRHDWTATAPSGAEAQANKQATTGRAGLMYLTDTGLAPYLSYSQSFLPNAPVTLGDGSTHIFPPMRGEQVEAGLKYQPVDERLLLTAALYDLREKNHVISNPVPTADPFLSTIGARGLELEGQAYFGWLDLYGSYTWTNNVRRESTAVQPHHQASLWSKYRWHGAELGAGVRYIGITTDDSGHIPLPPVTLFDALAAYEWRAWRFAVNATNLADKQYVTSCLARGDCFYGTQRAVVGSVAFHF